MAGVSYNKQRLHKAGYFRELPATNPDIDEGLCSLLRMCRETDVVVLLFYCRNCSQISGCATFTAAAWGFR